MIDVKLALEELKESIQANYPPRTRLRRNTDSGARVALDWRGARLLARLGPVAQFGWRHRTSVEQLRIIPVTSYRGELGRCRDGKQVAFSWDGEEDNYDIYVKLADAGDPPADYNAAPRLSSLVPRRSIHRLCPVGSSRTRILCGSGARWIRAQSGRYTGISDARPADHRGLVTRWQVACDHR
jgi:hypothetical protein